MKLCMNMKYTVRTSSADKRSEMCGKWQASYQQYYLASSLNKPCHSCLHGCCLRLTPGYLYNFAAQSNQVTLC